MAQVEKIYSKNAEKSDEEKAEDELQLLLSQRRYSFLTEIKINRDAIEGAESALWALSFAKERIEERIIKSMDLSEIKTIDGFSLKKVNALALYRTIESILDNQIEIGRGRNAFVVIDKNEIRELPPEICYKFLFTGRKGRGLVSPRAEAELQGDFYDVVHNLEDTIFDVPIPFYSLNIAEHRMIAMEKLDAISFEDLARGQGVIPEWFDLEKFCEELTHIIDFLHSLGMYHRDFHEGNLMLSQKSTLGDGDKQGFIIDFGHAGKSLEDSNAYRVDGFNETFTYTDDYGIIEKVKKIVNSREASL